MTTAIDLRGRHFPTLGAEAMAVMVATLGD